MMDLQLSEDECKTRQSQNDHQYSYYNWYPKKFNLHFCIEFSFKIRKQSSMYVLMDTLLQTDVPHISSCQTEEYVELLWKLFELSCLNGLFVCLFLTEEA